MVESQVNRLSSIPRSGPPAFGCPASRSAPAFGAQGCQKDARLVSSESNALQSLVQKDVKSCTPPPPPHPKHKSLTSSNIENCIKSVGSGSVAGSVEVLEELQAVLEELQAVLEELQAVSECCKWKSCSQRERCRQVCC